MTENSNYVYSYECLTNEIKGHFQIIHFVHLHQPNSFMQQALKPQFKHHSLRASPSQHWLPREDLTALKAAVAGCGSQCGQTAAFISGGNNEEFGHLTAFGLNWSAPTGPHCCSVLFVGLKGKKQFWGLLLMTKTLWHNSENRSSLLSSTALP